MALSFYFKFCAPASKTAAELERFFKRLEKEAQGMGFNPTLVVNANFDTAQRRDFARRLTTGLLVENESLKGVVLPRKEQVFSHDAVHGGCRVIPEQGVLLVVTNEHREEIVLGLLRYPEFLTDQNGKKITATGAGKDWRFEDFVDSPDPRYRALVQKIAEAGFLSEAHDEYSPGKNPFNFPAS